jgi:hypothetical protein
VGTPLVPTCDCEYVGGFVSEITNFCFVEV